MRGRERKLSDFIDNYIHRQSFGPHVTSQLDSWSEKSRRRGKSVAPIEGQA